ncbi:MFS transporter [Sphingomonas cavernae]|uniref:MFS transporter n=1 Tax=Sphingomonas cavernae TaxID=2320861 RepID=A0A418W796_9SPHN|nr:MFS transporter [Sphingomonas cavernae]RJF85916.1 MFS transporter [Sphingomonas cavernae]
MSDAVAARVPIGTKLAYGFGAVAYGIKDNGFSVFLLLFYNQVVGLPADRVGLAIMIALLVDAFIDPVVGHLSDQTHTRWGRRHPWLYLSAIPIGLVWLLLWNPPATSPDMQFIYLVGIAILVRAVVSCYEVPSLALAPEITRDYHERTVVLRYRFLFGWAGGLLMLVLAFAALLVPEPGYPVGQLNPNGYHRFAAVGAAIMLVAVLVSAIGTHRAYARRQAIAPERLPLVPTFKAIITTLRNRPFLILMGAAVFAFANQGLTFALSNYLLLFIWEFPQIAFIFYALALFAGVVIAFLSVAAISKRLGKPMAAATLAITSIIIGTLPYWLRLLDLFPGNESPWLMPAFLTFAGLSTAAAVSVMILTTSMMADITEASEFETGKRTEGLFFAGFFFTQKCVTGIGIFLSGVMLSAIGFPAEARPGAIDVAVVDRLALAYAALTISLGLCAAWAYTKFPFGRAEHEARLARLAVAAPPDSLEKAEISRPAGLAKSDFA